MHRTGTSRAGLAGLMAGLVLASVAGPIGAATEIWSRKDEYVRIEPQDDRSAPANDQPVELAPDRIRTLLGGLQVSFDEDEAPLPVFSKEELAVLGDKLSQALAKAGPDQDVSFVTVGSHGITAGGFLSKRLVNTGRVFYQGGKLNLIFGEVHASYQKKNVYGQMSEDFRPRRHASRGASAKGDWRLVEELPGVKVARADWLVLEPRQVALAGAAGSASPRRERPVSAAGLSAEPAPQTPAGQPAAQSAEERLAVLKRLREQQLIPEELYRTKLQEILDEQANAPSAGIEERLRALKALWQEGLIPEETYRARVEQIMDEL